MIFKENQAQIDSINEEVKSIKDSIVVSDFTYGFVKVTYAEAVALGVTKTQYYHITDARKSGEGAGNGTGLPAFYDESSSSWVDMLGNPITV